MIGVRGESGLSAIGAISVRDAGGLVSIAAGKIRDAAGLKAFFGTLAVQAVPESVVGRVNSGGSIAIQTQITTATPSGGKAPYSYLWTRTDAGGDAWEIIDPALASTRFRALGVGPGENFSATFACTVTDANGLTATSNNVDAGAANLSTSGEGPLP